MLNFLALLLLGLKCELEGIPHLSWRLARVLKQSLDPPAEAHFLTAVACCLLLLVAIVYLLLLEEEQGLPQH